MKILTGGEKKNAISEMKEQIQNLQQDLDDRGDAFEKLYEEHQQTLKVSNWFIGIPETVRVHEACQQVEYLG